MKKFFTLAVALCGFTMAQAQYNLFNAADVDEDGWLWLNTQEKIDKYVGVIDEDNYTVDPNGKPIQMAFANITPDYPGTVADPDATGTDTQGYLFADEEANKDEIIKGGIILASASGILGNTNGGCLVLNLPSCSSIGLYLSSEGSVFGRTLKLTAGHAIDNDDSTSGNPWTGSTKAIYVQAGPFTVNSICDKGQYKWETAATDNNSYNEGVTFESDGPVYFCLQNCRNRPVYVHAIKVTTPKQETTRVGNIATGNKPAIWYNLSGQQVSNPSNGVFFKDGRAIIVK